MNPHRRAPALMVGASALFALMGACVKLASEHYGAGEIVAARSAVGLALMAAVMQFRRIPLATPVPRLHLSRGVSGTVALCLWFTAIGGLPLATAMTLNYMSSVWMAAALTAGAWWALRAGHAAEPPDRRRLLAIAAGFAGVVLVLQPTVADEQLLHGLLGLTSGMLAAVAYLQVTALGRAGEPGERVVFYFSLTGVVFGVAYAAVDGLSGQHSLRGVLLLLAIGTLATLAQWMMTRAYATGVTLGIAALQYLGIVFSSLIGIAAFGERLSPAAWAGIALILAAGVAATLLRAPARQAPADAPRR